MTIEVLLNDAGGCGRFQIFLIICLFFNKFIVGWSMLQMSFAGLVPKWHCLSLNEVNTDNETLSACSLSTNVTGGSTICEGYHFLGPFNTIISEWSLVCDMRWVKATVTSIQMTGVLVGNLLSGQMSAFLGRKKTTYFFVLEHAVSNIIAAFSVNWQMFAVCRFFIGMGIGGVMVGVFPYSIEFSPMKWRPVLAVVPSWALGNCAVALAAVVFNDWSHIHLACGVIALIGLPGYFFAPESMRWLTVQGRVKEAEIVLAQIAKINQKVKPEKAATILQEVADTEKRARESGKKYTYIDVFRGWQTAKITFIFCYHWFVLSCVYYGISFGVGRLSGNVQLNIFLLAIVDVPAGLSTIYLCNKIGRKWTCVLFMGIACLSAFSSLVTEMYGPQATKGYIVRGLSLTAKMGIGAAWGSIQTWGAELYPTVTRNLGFGAANTVSRIGGIVASFVINFDDMMVISYIVIGCLSLVSVLCMLVTPETKGTDLADSILPAYKKGDNHDIAAHNEKDHMNSKSYEKTDTQITHM
uniref:Major facilitator superfamily (MFS) profile domain-containing protein n=1 Tax=Arion vulgaris TaxID=1028688 RepID=A0A0B7AZ05_9EUPU